MFIARHPVPWGLVGSGITKGLQNRPEGQGLRGSLERAKDGVWAELHPAGREMGPKVRGVRGGRK